MDFEKHSQGNGSGQALVSERGEGRSVIVPVMGKLIRGLTAFPESNGIDREQTLALLNDEKNIATLIQMMGSVDVFRPQDARELEIASIQANFLITIEKFGSTTGQEKLEEVLALAEYALFGERVNSYWQLLVDMYGNEQEVPAKKIEVVIRGLLEIGAGKVDDINIVRAAHRFNSDFLIPEMLEKNDHGQLLGESEEKSLIKIGQNLLSETRSLEGRIVEFSSGMGGLERLKRYGSLRKQLEQIDKLLARMRRLGVDPSMIGFVRGEAGAISAELETYTGVRKKDDESGPDSRYKQYVWTEHPGDTNREERYHTDLNDLR